MVKAKTWILVKHFEDLPKESDFRLEEQELPEINDGEVLTETLYLSVDPYLRSDVELHHVGLAMAGTHVAKVIECKDQTLPVGTYVVNELGWTTYSVTTLKQLAGFARVIPDMGDLPKSLALGVLGMPGMTAYFGFLRVCKPAAGETVLVNAAAGAVGSIVGQIAKIKGCRVIGYAGSDEKCKWIKEELGFDYAFNYKKTDLHQTLKEAAPNGVDCYFDNVGGPFTTIALSHMNMYGRVSICGCISGYGKKKEDIGTYFPFYAMIMKEMKVEGFTVYRWETEWPSAVKEMAEWISQGKLKYRETITEGFEKMPKAFAGLFSGENI